MSPSTTHVEIELTWLAASLPDVAGCHHVAMEDVYFPDDPDVHPRLRARRRGDVHEMTKKLPMSGSDGAAHTEMTIPLSPREYSALVDGHQRRVTKIRFLVSLEGRDAEVDVFQGALRGLVLIDFEFGFPSELAAFRAPACCLADVTRHDFLAGGLLAGKSYDDIPPELERFGYTPLALA